MPRVVPRKTAWSTRQEFRLVFDRLFASQGDIALQQDAIGRIQVWLNRGQCPHAVESTAALLQLILRDAEPSTSTAPYSVPEHELRLSYSMAIIRFVNSLVDPLQTTYYARSIASLAAQIGLPAWFVELRHQATHEDLPSIAVLRDAARQALDWLYANYWLPALESASATSSLEAALPPLPLSTLRPLLLTTYKSLAKQFTRDASLAGKLKADVQKTYKDIERWIADNSLGGGIRGGKKEEEARERALEAVAEILWEEGGLVPLAKKKRPSTRSPGLPTELRALWSPLLSHFDNLYDGALSETITRRGIDMLCAGTATSTATAEGLERTYAACVVAWVAELLKDAPLGEIPSAEVVAVTIGQNDDADEDDEEEEDSEEAKELTIKNVLRTCLLSRSLHAIPLIETLLSSSVVTEHPELNLDPSTTPSTVPFVQRIKSLLPLLRAQALVATPSSSNPTTVDFVRKVESTDEANRIVREMENRSDQVEVALKKQNRSSSSSSSRPRLGDGGDMTNPVGVSSSSSSSSHHQGGGGGGDDDVEMQQPQQGDPKEEEKEDESVARSAEPAQQQQRQQLWTKRPIGTLPKGGVLALDLAPWPEQHQQQQQRAQVV